MIKIEIVALLLMLLFLGCSSKENQSSAILSEASGLLYSQKYPNILWTHNDSGDKPRLYALDAKTYELLRTIKIKGAKHKDWEDITYYNGKIVIGDIGNNKSRRDHLKLYVIDEPNPYEDKKAVVKSVMTFTYSNQHGKKIKNFDAEALFSFNNALFILTKHREDTQTTLYKIKKKRAQKIVDFPIGGKVTGADSNSRYVAVLTYDTLWLLEPSQQSDNIFDGNIYHKSIRMGQAEGVAFHGENIDVIHENGDIFVYSIDEIIKE
jgi:hypothetical protein